MPNQDVMLCQDTHGVRAHGLRADKEEQEEPSARCAGI